MMTVSGIRQDFRERGSQTEDYEAGGDVGGRHIAKKSEIGS